MGSKKDLKPEERALIVEEYKKGGQTYRDISSNLSLPFTLLI